MTASTGLPLIRVIQRHTSYQSRESDCAAIPQLAVGAHRLDYQYSTHLAFAANLFQCEGNSKALDRRDTWF